LSRYAGAVKVFGVLYLIYVVFTTALGAFLGSGACAAILGHHASHHPWLAGALYVVLFSVLFCQGLLLHLRVPSNTVLSLGALIIVGLMVAALHFLG
jgi:hypothetical protein